MGRMVRSCVQSLLKLVNSVIGMVGFAMVLYSIWMFRVWQRHMDGPDYPAPWFIYTFLGIGASLCVITCSGHIAAETANGCCLYFAGCKFLIFAHHHPMIDSIHQFLLKKKVGCIRIDGGTPAASRQALVTEFQEKDSIRAAVLSIRAAGVGLTFTAASTVIFVELSWTPGDIIQAEDRTHRIGQVSHECRGLLVHMIYN